MADEQPEEHGLPDLNLNPIKIKEKREPGTIDEEIALMLQRMEDKKPFPEKVVTICAMGVTRALCPFDTETWACNMGYWQIFELDGYFSKIFLTHGQVLRMDNHYAFDWNEFNKLVDAGIEVYNIHQVKDLNSKMYPLKRIIKKYGTDYFSNTIAYQVAYALDKGYKTINIYGCDMKTQEEYAWEKGGIEYWIGRAQQAGIEVNIVEGSSLLKTITGKPYGIKHFYLKDIDPDGSIRRTRHRSMPLSPALSREYATGRSWSGRQRNSVCAEPCAICPTVG